jgi:hypothetical protein
MGQKMVCFEALRGTRSRQDESIEVGEVKGGRKKKNDESDVHLPQR